MLLPELTNFASGAIAMGFAVGACFFLRFWVRTKEGLFFAFAAAFLLLAINQGLVTVLGLPFEERSWLYILRFAAFSLIIFAVLRKNLSDR